MNGCCLHQDEIKDWFWLPPRRPSGRYFLHHRRRSRPAALAFSLSLPLSLDLSTSNAPPSFPSFVLKQQHKTSSIQSYLFPFLASRGVSVPIDNSTRLQSLFLTLKKLQYFLSTSNLTWHMYSENVNQKRNLDVIMPRGTRQRLFKGASLGILVFLHFFFV